MCVRDIFMGNATGQICGIEERTVSWPAQPVDNAFRFNKCSG